MLIKVQTIEPGTALEFFSKGRRAEWGKYFFTWAKVFSINTEVI